MALDGAGWYKMVLDGLGQFPKKKRRWTLMKKRLTNASSTSVSDQYLQENMTQTSLYSFASFVPTTYYIQFHHLIINQIPYR